LLSPVRLGVQAFSWAAGKLENNRIGLPTSPSSSDVQNRVLQAAAKHESQPSETELSDAFNFVKRFYGSSFIMRLISCKGPEFF
jgi:hypothetical protein